MTDPTKASHAEPLNRDAGARAGDGKTLASEREAFDAWAGDQGYPLRRIHDDEDQGYLDLRTEGAWGAWQAAIATFLERTGQYVTNDATREAALTEAYAEGRKDEAEERGKFEAAIRAEPVELIAKWRVLELLAAAPAVSAPAWQPIATAPRDGSEVLIFEVYERLPVIGWWSEKRKRWYASTEVYDTDGDATVIDKLYADGVTHWMPLPAPPAMDANDEEPQ